MKPFLPLGFGILRRRGGGPPIVGVATVVGDRVIVRQRHLTHETVASNCSRWLWSQLVARGYAVGTPANTAEGILP